MKTITNQRSRCASQDVQELRERISELEEQICNLKRLEETIRRNAAMFEALISAARDGITLTRLDGTIIRVLRPILGYDPKDLIGRSIFDLVDEPHRQLLLEHYRSLVENRRKQLKFEIQINRGDSSKEILAVTMTDMLDDPNVFAIVLNYSKITALRQSEIAALELSAIAEYVPFAIFSKDLAGHVLSWNRGAEAMFGYTSNEILGAHISRLIPPEWRAEEVRLRQQVIESGKTLPPFQTVRLHQRGHSVPVTLTLTPLLRDGVLRGIAHLSWPSPDLQENDPA